MELLYILIFFVIGIVFLAMSWYLFGKGGLLAFAVFATILANYQANGGTVDVFGLAVVPSAPMYVLLATALILMLHKFGVKSAILYMVVIITTSVLDVVSDQVRAALLNDPATDITLVVRVCCGNVLATLINGFAAIGLYTFLKKKNMHYLLNIALTLVVMLAVDAVVFVTVAYAGSSAFGEFMLIMLNNWWHKLVFVALTVPLVYGLLKIKNFNLAATLEAKENVNAAEYESRRETVVLQALKEDIKNEPAAKTEEKTKK